MIVLLIKINLKTTDRAFSSYVVDIVLDRHSDWRRLRRMSLISGSVCVCVYSMWKVVSESAMSVQGG